MCVTWALCWVICLLEKMRGYFFVLVLSFFCYDFLEIDKHCFLQSIVARTWLLMVIVTRVIKNEIKALLRGTMAKVFFLLLFSFFPFSFSSFSFC